ncbi:right-handed parallel beta-helix repeat-containing protein, partial [bacterium]|nr:right-handed parallel beta-helix repeat-containing protein [bacterium]
MKKILMTIIILLSLANLNNVEAKTYYVDFDNGSDFNDGTSIITAWKNLPGTSTAASTNVHPCTFLSNSWPKINAGDIIKIKSGTIHDSTDGGRIHINSTYYNNGTSDQPIMIQRDPQWGTGTVVIDGAGLTVATYYAMLTIYKIDYIIIDGVVENGIKIQNSSEQGIFIYDSGVNGSELRNLEIYNSTKINIKITSSDKTTPTYIGDITISDVEVHKTNTLNDAGSNIYITFAENLLVQDSTSYDTGGDGIHIGSCRNVWILDNLVYNKVGAGEQGIDLSISGDYKGRDDGYNITVRGNIAYDNYKMNFDHNSGVHDVYYIHNVAYHTTTPERYDGNFHVYEGTIGKNFWINNTSTKGRDWGFGAVWSGNPWGLPAGTYQQYYINNISSGDGNGIDSGESVYIGDSYDSRIFGTNYYNNNLHSAIGTTVIKDKGTLYTADNINNGTGGWPGINCISKDPLFVSIGSTWETTDLNLSASSPSKNTGVFPFTTSSSGSGTIITLNRLVSDLDARRVFRAGDIIQIEDSGRYHISSVESSTSIALSEMATWEAAKGVWFPWDGTKLNMGAMLLPMTVTYTLPPDTTDPIITITSPTSGDTYSTEEDSVSLGGSASDNIGVTSVTWINSRGGSGTASGTDNWTISNVSLQEGDNVITVTAHDAAGN